MRKGTRVFIALFALTLAACDDGSQQKESTVEADAPMGSVSYGGGGGSVRVGTGQSSRETIADSYKKALDSIKKRDWDGARTELVDALRQSEGHPIEKDIQEHLKIVEQGLLAQPTHEVTELFLHAPEFYDKIISVRGTFIPGGEIGRTTYYFWIRTSARKIQARYSRLPLKDKKTILLLKEGAQILGRGTLKSPWGSNPNPYIDLSYFRLERLSPEREKAQQKRKREEERPQP